MVHGEKSSKLVQDTDTQLAEIKRSSEANRVNVVRQILSWCVGNLFWSKHLSAVVASILSCTYSRVHACCSVHQFLPRQEHIGNVVYPCIVAIQTVEMQQGVDSGHDNTESSRLISRTGSSYLMCRLRDAPAAVSVA